MTTGPDAPPTTVLPYGPGNRWTFTSRSGGHTQIEELALRFCPAVPSCPTVASPTTSLPKTSGRGGLAKSRTATTTSSPDQFRPGEIPIYRTVTRPG